MSARLYDKGRQGFADGSIDWDTDTVKAIQLLLDGSVTDLGIKQVTAATNASPIVVTATSHGFANGDIVVIRGAAGNTAANGTWQVANQATNTFELKTIHGTGLNSTGNGTFSGTACVLNLTLTDNLDDISAARVGADHGALASKTATNGVLDAADLSFSGVTGTIHGLTIYKDTGTESTSRLIHFIDGRIQVVVAADAASSATTLWVEPLEGDLANSTAIVLSNGVTATLTAGATEGARSLTVSALSGAVAAGHTGDAQSTNSGLPITLSSGAYTVQFSNGANKIVKI